MYPPFRLDRRRAGGQADTAESAYLKLVKVISSQKSLMAANIYFFMHVKSSSFDPRLGLRWPSEFFESLLSLLPNILPFSPSRRRRSWNEVVNRNSPSSFDPTSRLAGNFPPLASRFPQTTDCIRWTSSNETSDVMLQCEIVSTAPLPPSLVLGFPFLLFVPL